MVYRTCVTVGFMVLITFLTTNALGQVVTSVTPVGNTRSLQRTSRGSSTNRVVSLRDQLLAGLKVRRQVEKQFVDEVVRLVRERRLPTKLVLETFHYARRKPTKYPFQYFQRALAIRASRIGVRIRTV